MDKSRRRFVQGSVSALTVAGLAGSATGKENESEDGWWRGDLAHLLPMVSHERILIKASFNAPLTETPRLRVDDDVVDGRRADTGGRFWRFDVGGLPSATTFGLQIQSSNGDALCDPWPLATYPDPDADVEQMRFLIYTCAGGDEDKVTPDGRPEAITKAVRRKLFARGLSFAPDAVIGIGDQVYLDIETGMADPVYGEAVRRFFEQNGFFDSTLPVLGSRNEGLLKRYIDAQIAQLYGVMFRSVPTYLTMDDHDYFENDVANDRMITFPVSSFNLRLGRATQHLYFPEFLPDRNRPLGLSGSAAADRAAGLSETYGTLRFGRLLEMLMYDCRRFMDLKGPHARFVARDAEEWLHARTRDDSARHLVHVPSTPMGWSAGKWGEWYPDVLDGKNLTVEKPKPYWQPGWFSQHQRIIESLARQARRPAVMISGDMHAIGYGKITRSGDFDLRDNPVHSILAGPLGTEDEGYPSFYRGIGAQVPRALEVDEVTPPMEKLGFTLVDVTPDTLSVRQFAWRAPEDEALIAGLEPFATYDIARS